MARRRSTRSRALLIGATAAIGGAAFVGTASVVRAEEPARTGVVAAVSVEAADVGASPAISGDGRLVVFVGTPPTADGRSSTVYLRDRSTGVTSELTVPSPATPIGDSLAPVISDDGCVVAVVTQIAYDLFRDDNRGARWDVYSTVLPDCEGRPGEWQLVSTAGTTARGDVDPSDRPAISASGAVIAYTHVHTDVPQPSEGRPITAIDVVDLTIPLGDPARTHPAAGLPVEPPRTTYRYRGQSQPSLSSDGRHVAFRSDTTANDVLPSWGAGPTAGQYATTQVFVWDRQAPTPAEAVRLVSAGAAAPNGDAAEPVLSADGRIVAFSSASTNLIDGAVMPPCAQSCPTQVYVLDRDPDADGVFDEDPPPAGLSLVSRDPVASAPDAGFVAGTGASSQPTVSADGSLIAFVTQATNLLPVRALGGGNADQGEIVVADRATGALRRASTAADGVTPAAALNAHPDISETGRVIVFDTAAPQITGDVGTGTRRIAAVTHEPRITMAALDVGTVAPGYTGEEWYTSVANAGPTSFLPSTVVSSSPEFTVTGGTCLTAGSVPPGGSCTVTVVFAPTQGGPRDGTLTVAEEGFGALSISAEVRGSGGEPSLVGDPSGYDFGNPVVGTPGGATAIGITNVGLAPAVIGDISITGVNPEDFTVTDDRCRRRTVNPGSTCTVEVSFTPTDDGPRSASLLVSTTGAHQYTAVVLGGAGHYEPQLTMANPVVRTGSRLDVGGAGFPPNAAVTIAWADGIGQSATATTADDGSFATQIVIPRGERTGERVLVASVSADITTTGVVRVVRADARGPASAAWPGR